MNQNLVLSNTFEKRSGDCPHEFPINAAFTPGHQAVSIGLVGTRDIEEGDAR